MAWIADNNGIKIDNARIPGSSLSALAINGNFRTISALISARLQSFANLADLADATAARSNLGLGSAATHNAADFDAVGAATTVSTALSAHVAATGSAVHGLGSASTRTVGTAPGNVVALDNTGKLPAVDGSQLTNLPIGPSVPGTAGQVQLANGSGGLSVGAHPATEDLTTGDWTFYRNVYAGNDVRATGVVVGSDLYAGSSVNLNAGSFGYWTQGGLLLTGQTRIKWSSDPNNAFAAETVSLVPSSGTLTVAGAGGTGYGGLVAGTGTINGRFLVQPQPGGIGFQTPGGADTTFLPFSDGNNYIRGKTIIADDAVGSRVLIGVSADTGSGAKLQVSGGPIDLPVLSSAPSGPAERTSYYDTTLHKARTFDGTIWQNWW